jgi:hypothetical protein
MSGTGPYSVPCQRCDRNAVQRKIAEDYYMRAVEEMREHYQGNPPYFE